MNADHAERLRKRLIRFAENRAKRNSLWVTDQNGVVHIPLKSGHEALIDQGDRESAQKYSWHVRRSGSSDCIYAHAYISTGEKQRDSIFLHHLVMGVSKPNQVDHIDRNGLNCTRSNLRHATPSQNIANRITPPSRYGYKGVTPLNRGTRWRAHITYKSKQMYLGSFPTKEDAAVAYNEAAKKFHGEFAVLNEIGK